uniref:Geminin n=1 Tax=Elaeophora elaphi TaxID=1147741 RepID=A0A0R3S4K8_9BILA
MPGGTLRQVQNISTHTTRKAGELKVSKTTTNTKEEYKQSEAKIESQKLKSVKRNLRNTKKKLNETKTLKAVLLHEKVNTVEAAVQTDVTASSELPKLTAEDLRSPEVSANYWRRLAERLSVESEQKAKINFELSIRLAQLNEEIAEKEDDYIALRHYIFDKENTEHISDFELSKDEEPKRQDENDGGDHLSRLFFT